MSASIQRQIVAAVVTELNRSRPSGIPTFTGPIDLGSSNTATITAMVLEGDEAVEPLQNDPDAPHVRRTLNLDVQIRGFKQSGSEVQATLDDTYLHVVKRLSVFKASGLLYRMREVAVGSTYEPANRLAFMKTVQFTVEYRTRRDDPSLAS